MGRISGPLMDRFDIRIEVPAVSVRDLSSAPAGEATSTIAERVAQARTLQRERYAAHPEMRVNADLEGDMLNDICSLDADADAMLSKATEKFGLTARGYHRVLRVARTIADLDGTNKISSGNIAEAIGYRLTLMQ